MKNHIRYLVFFLAVGSACAQSNLPVCKGTDTLLWNLCSGTSTFPNGETFVGEWQTGQANGQGSIIFGDGSFKGDKYVGQFRNNRFSGRGTYSYANGEKYVGEFKDGKFNGQGTFIFTSGEKYVGEYRDDKRSGLGTLTYVSGDKYVGEFKDGQFNGRGIYTFADGDKFVGEFRDDKRNGLGTLTITNGEKYVGEYRDDKRSGLGTYFYANGGKYVGEYRNGNSEGLGTFYAPDGSIINQGIWADNKFVRFAHSGVVPVGNGTFMVSRQAGAFPSGKEPLLAEALAEANVMCSSLRKPIKIISTNENMQAIGNFPKASVIFSCEYVSTSNQKS